MLKSSATPNTEKMMRLSNLGSRYWSSTLRKKRERKKQMPNNSASALAIKEQSTG